MKDVVVACWPGPGVAAEVEVVLLLLLLLLDSPFMATLRTTGRVHELFGFGVVSSGRRRSSDGVCKDGIKVR